MNAVSIEAVVFDMDGLLLDSERLYLEGFRRARVALRLAPDDALYHGLIGTNEVTGMELLHAAMGDGAQPFADQWHQENRGLFDGPLPLKPTVRVALDGLAARGVRRFVATSTDRAKARARLDAAGIGELLPDLVGGDEVSQGKPHPEIYETAARILGLPPERCAAFEDSAHGVRSAVAAGMVVTQVPDLVAPDAALLALGHRVAPDLRAGLEGLGLL